MQDGLDESFNSCMAPVDVALSNRRVCGRRAMHAFSLVIWILSPLWVRAENIKYEEVNTC
jgi:hypothetical protein